MDTPGLVDGDMIYPFEVNNAITSFGKALPKTVLGSYISRAVKRKFDLSLPARLVNIFWHILDRQYIFGINLICSAELKKYLNREKIKLSDAPKAKK